MKVAFDFLFIPIFIWIFLFFSLEHRLSWSVRWKTSGTKKAVVIASIAAIACIAFQLSTGRTTTAEVFDGKTTIRSCLPEDIRGHWFEASDSVVLNRKKPDEFIFHRDSVVFVSRWNEPGGEARILDLDLEEVVIQGEAIYLKTRCRHPEAFVGGKYDFCVRWEDSGDFLKIYRADRYSGGLSERSRRIQFTVEYLIGRFYRR